LKKKGKVFFKRMLNKKPRKALNDSLLKIIPDYNLCA
jgi:hypothetical protein